MAAVLKQRAKQSPPPIQMCDAFAKHPKSIRGGESFWPTEECRYVLEALGEVYYNDATAREQALSAGDRLTLHQKQSGPVMEQLHAWLEAQFAEKKTEPNSAWAKRSFTCSGT